ncbi:hypothetical protein BOTCAL_0307g00070 [Botryotinia calthae]|nr:hypothetical protein BOTCAL_0307g00070 [Botryotinia calthae]
MPLLPVAMYGLEVPAGDILIPAVPDFPATFRITMAAIDPTEPADDAEGVKPRSTLKVIRQSSVDEEEDSEDDDEGSDDLLRALLADNDSGSDEDSEDDEEANGGPSDPSKSKKAQKQAAL